MRLGDELNVVWCFVENAKRRVVIDDDLPQESTFCSSGMAEIIEMIE
jgi:hypothetical protein